MSILHYRRVTIALLIESHDSRRLMAASLSLMALVGLLATCAMRVDALVQWLDTVVAGAVAWLLVALVQVEGGAKWSTV